MDVVRRRPRRGRCAQSTVAEVVQRGVRRQRGYRGERRRGRGRREALLLLLGPPPPKW
jgi:hypothetical protein